MNLKNSNLMTIQTQLNSTFAGKILKLLSDFLIHYLWEKRWFFIALFVGGVLMLGWCCPGAWLVLPGAPLSLFPAKAGGGLVTPLLVSMAIHKV